MNDTNGIIAGIMERSKAVFEQGDYIKDGLLYCGKCGTAKQCRIDFGMGLTTVGCMCECAEKRYKAQEQARKEEERAWRIHSLRRDGIADHSLLDCTFAHAENTPEIAKCRTYIKQWLRMKATNSGLLFWGDTGRGKTYCAACIANALIDAGIPALITSFPRILSAGWDKSEIAGQMQDYDLVVIDDLGVERNSSYARETVYMIVDERYKANLPLIVTTNIPLEVLQDPLSLAEKNQTAVVEYKRIYERILEMCVPVKFTGQSFRQKKTDSKFKAAVEIFQNGGAEPR